MRVTAREIIAQKRMERRATTYVGDLLSAIRKSLDSRWQWESANYNATGVEAKVRDTGQWPMEYVIDIRPVQRPQDVTLQ